MEEAVQSMGWTYAPGGISSVEVSLNGGSPRRAVLGLSRPDVAERLSEPDATDCGWTVSIPASDLVEGENVAQVTARGSKVGRIVGERRFSWRRLGAGEIPYMQVDLVGEQYDPRYPHVNSVAIEHHARYLVACSIVSGRRVLDAGCGFGYGARMLASAGAASVDAIDAQPTLIAQAKQLQKGSGIRFRSGEIRQLPYDDRAFDLIVCFETMERALDHDELLEEFSRTLAPGGVLLVSTPNRGHYLVDNPWHPNELTPDELEAILRARFANVMILRQQLALASLICDADLLSGRSPVSDASPRLAKLAGGAPGSERFDLGVASNGALPEFEPLLTVGDARDELVEATIADWTQRALKAEAEVAMLRNRVDIARHFNHFREDRPAPGLSEERTASARALRQELESPPAWVHDWELGKLGRVQGTALSPNQRTMWELMEPSVCTALTAAGSDARVLDLRCGEGWFGHRVLERGARSVIGFDTRPHAVRRARLVRDYLGTSPQSLAFYEGDIFSLPDLGTFDVVLMLGVLTTLDNPLGAFRIARALARSLLVVETPLAQQPEPMAASGDPLGVRPELRGTFAARPRKHVETTSGVGYNSVLTLIPDEAALLQTARSAGFVGSEIIPVGPHHEQVYRRRERALMIGWAS